MILLKLEAENYKSFQDVEINFNDQGLVCILGSTDDPLSPSNGAGKSTIRSAITWCWFGKNNAGQKADAVLSWFEPKNCKVTTTLCHSIVSGKPTKVVKIIRYRNHDKHENQIYISIDGSGTHYSDNDEAQKLIDSLLGFNYELFSLLLTAGSNSKKLVPFAQMTDSERKDFMDYLLDLGYLNNARLLVASDIKTSEAEIATIENEMSVKKELQDDLIGKYNDYITRKERYNLERQAKINEVEKENVSVKASLENIKEAKAQTTTKFNEIVVPVVDTVAYNKAVKQLKADLAKLEELNETRATKKRDAYTAGALIKKDMDNLIKKDYTALAYDSDSLNKINKDINEAQVNLSIASKKSKETYVPRLTQTQEERRLVIREEQTKVTANIGHLKTQVVALEAKLKKAVSSTEVSSVCEACGQVIDMASLGIYTNNINANITKINDDIKTLQQQLLLCTTKEKEFIQLCKSENEKAFIAEIDTHLKSVDTFDKQIVDLRASYKKELTNLANKEKAKDEKIILALRNKLLEKTNECDIIGKDIESTNKEIENLKERISAHDEVFQQASIVAAKAVEEKNTLNLALNNLEHKQKAVEDLLASNIKKIATIKAEPNPYIELADNISIEIAKSADIIKAKTTKRLEKITSLRYLTYLEKAFSNTGIKSFILDSVISMLNTKAEYCLDKLTNGEIKVMFSTQKELKSSKEMRENFNIKIVKNGNDALYDDLSKGEKCKTDTAINNSLQNLAESYHGAKLNFKLYDEAFDGLDAVGCNQIVRYLREELTHFNSIFVVSHTDSLRQLFDNVMIVSKKDGRTSIKF